MAYTGTEIFNMAIAVIDELSDTGAATDSDTTAIAAGDVKVMTSYI